MSYPTWRKTPPALVAQRSMAAPPAMGAMPNRSMPAESRDGFWLDQGIRWSAPVQPARHRQTGCHPLLRRNRPDAPLLAPGSRPAVRSRRLRVPHRRGMARLTGAPTSEATWGMCLVLRKRSITLDAIIPSPDDCTKLDKAKLYP